MIFKKYSMIFNKKYSMIVKKKDSKNKFHKKKNSIWH